MKTLRTLIIEDHPAAETDLRERLSRHPEVAVVGAAGSFESAQEILQNGRYDLVFLDIQLRGGNGFDLLPYIAATARVIFVTAYDQYAVRAFEVNALDFLLKPVQPARLAQSLARLADREDAAAPPSPFPSSLRADDRIHLREEAGTALVSLGEISAITAAQNYTEVFLHTGHRALVRRPLKDWESSLDRTDFVQISRDTLINLQNVTRHERTGSRGGAIWLRGLPDPVQASFRRWPAVRARLETG